MKRDVSSLVLRKPLWHRNSPSNMRRNSGKERCSCVGQRQRYPHQSRCQEQGGWWKKSKGNKNQASEIGKKKILSPQEGFTAQKPQGTDGQEGNTPENEGSFLPADMDIWLQYIIQYTYLVYNLYIEIFLICIYFMF